MIDQVRRFSRLKSWAVRLAGRRGFRKAAVATAPKIAVFTLMRARLAPEIAVFRAAATQRPNAATVIPTHY